MNSFGVVFEEMNKHGLQVEVARKGKDGILQSARPEELATLATKSRVATAAKLLQNLTVSEKQRWAVDTKEEGNILFQERKYAEAMEKYVEALSASDFGAALNSGSIPNTPEEDADLSKSSVTEGNIDTLIVPILCNLSACSIQLQLWYKAAQFADHAITLRPTCRKAALRKGIALYHITEFQESLLNFRCAAEEGGIMPLTEEDGKRLQHYKRLTLEGLKREKEAVQSQKLRLQEVFGGAAKPAQSFINLDATALRAKVEEPMGILEALWIMIMFIFEQLRRIISASIFGIDQKSQT